MLNYLNMPSWVSYRVSSEDPSSFIGLVTQGPASFLVQYYEAKEKFEEGALLLMSNPRNR
jgi:hypothetical protein